MDRILIFGAANTGSVAYDKLNLKYDVIGFVDNDSSKWGTFFKGRRVYAPIDITSLNVDSVVVASIYYREICKQLSEFEPINILVYFEKCSDNLVKYFPGELFGKVELSDLSNNKEKKKRILFCSYWFPPVGGACVQRSLKFTKYLRDFGYEPVVLTSENINKVCTDESLLQELPKDIEIIRIPDGYLADNFVSYTDQEQTLRLLYDVVQDLDWCEKFVSAMKNPGQFGDLLPLNTLFWTNRCVQKIEDIVKIEDINLVYTSGDPFASFLVGFYLKKYFHKPWVQDYRDPWVSNDFVNRKYHLHASSECYKLISNLEKNLCFMSDKIVTASVPVQKDYVEKYGIDGDKLVEITNGFDEPDFEGIEKKKYRNDRFMMCYNGSLHLDRDPIPLLRVINRAIDDDVIPADKIQWVINGIIPDNRLKEMKEIDKYNILQINGYLSHKESLQIAMDSDLLILYGSSEEGSECVYTGKFFEYLYMNNPILAISRPDGVIGNALKQLENGGCFLVDDEIGISAYLLERYQEWQNAGKSQILFLNRTKIEQFSRKNLTRKLSEVFDEFAK